MKEISDRVGVMRRGKLMGIHETASVTAEQLGIDAGDTAYPYIVISNGRVLEANLKHIGRDLNWLNKQLESHGAKNAAEVFLMTADQTDHVYLARKEEKHEA